MVIGTSSLEYLDLCNYLGAGTSLDSFYKAYNLNTEKGPFPYQWLTSLDKLNYTGLLTQSCFKSTLTNKEIDEEPYMSYWRVWNKQNMTTFADYVEYYTSQS